MAWIRLAAGDCDGGCEHPEVEIGHDDASELLPAGTKVLAPCRTCGCRPLETLNMLHHQLTENERAFGRYLTTQVIPLFHWSPRARRAQITRYGLRPCMRPTTHVGEGMTWRAGYICLADTPSWAWALSGAMPSAPAGEWDLWQTTVDRLTEPMVMPADWSNGIHEIRTASRVYKRDLWHVGTRTK